MSHSLSGNVQESRTETDINDSDTFRNDFLINVFEQEFPARGMVECSLRIS